MRLILFTGAGGAGVTTLAAATAALIAGAGTPVLLVGAEDEPLRDVLGPPEHLPATLRLAVADADAALGADAGGVLAWLRSLLAWGGLDPALVQQLSLIPTARLLAALLKATGEREGVAVVDLGPAAGALPLLHLLATDPAAVSDADGLGQLTARLAGPVISRLVDLPRPDAGVRGAGERAAGRLERLRVLLRDTAATSVRLVLPADGRAPFVERETRTVCGLHGLGFDAILARAPVPGSDEDAPPRLDALWQSGPPRGQAALADLARLVCAGRDPSAGLSPPRVPRVELTDDGADLLLPLPARPAEQFRVGRSGARLTVQAGEWRRSLALPAALRGLTGRRAWHDGGGLRIRFGR